MDLIFDEHGIWFAKDSNELSYPKEGLEHKQNCYEVFVSFCNT